IALAGGGSYPIEFKPVPGFVTPSNRTVTVQIGQTVSLTANYAPILARLTLAGRPTNGTLQLKLNGPTLTSYVLDSATNLRTPIAWQPIRTNITDTNGAASFTDPSASAKSK